MVCANLLSSKISLLLHGGVDVGEYSDDDGDAGFDSIDDFGYFGSQNSKV